MIARGAAGAARLARTSSALRTRAPYYYYHYYYYYYY